MHYVYPCNLTPDEEEGEGYVVTFPDVPGAITGALTREESLELAEDALVVALTGYVLSRWDIPVPSAALPGQEMVAVRTVLAAKLALYTAMRRQGVTKVELARLLGLSEGAVRKLCNPGHRSHVDSVETALRALGRGLVVADRAA